MNRRMQLSILALALKLSLHIVPSPGAEIWSPDPPAGSNDREAADSVKLARPRPTFELSRVDQAVIKELEKAWSISKNGTNGREGAVLIFLASGGSYLAKVQRRTNEEKKVTFTWADNAIAIVHTHPNRTDPRPSTNDMKLADRLNVAMLTISLYGMWVYNPATRRTTLVHRGLDWLDHKRWVSL